MSASAAVRLPPGPKGAIRNLIAFRRDPLAFFTRSARTYGDISCHRMGNRTVYFINHPDLIKDLLVTSNHKFHKSLVLQRSKRLLGEGLLTSEGEFHLRQRRLAQPAFHRQRVAHYGENMVEHAARMAAEWQPGATIDVHEQMMRLTLAVVGKTLFDYDSDAEAGEIGEALEIFLGMFGMIFLPFSELLERLPIPPMIRLNQARKRLDAIIFRLIRERRASGEDRGDLLSMLLRAQDVEGDGGGMSDQQLRDECVTLILAGHETTANALTWTWMLLSQNPEAETKMHAEIDALGGRRLTFEDLGQLKYTEMVLAESMRLFPPAWAIGRMAMEEHEMAGYRIPPRSMVVCSQWVMHHDARYYPRPELFDPERWRPEARAARPKFSYFPFGGGPRQCIGEAFAWMEGVLLLATLAERWKLRLPAGFVPAWKPLITLRPKGPMRMRLESRS